MRKIHLDSGVWQYRVGKREAVIFSPNKKKYTISKGILPNLEYDGKDWSGHDGYRVSPSDIRNYIEQNLQ